MILGVRLSCDCGFSTLFCVNGKATRKFLVLTCGKVTLK